MFNLSIFSLFTLPSPGLGIKHIAIGKNRSGFLKSFYTLNLPTRRFISSASLDRESAEADTSSMAAVSSSVEAATFCTPDDICSVA
jgi:hypothetical protein